MYVSEHTKWLIPGPGILEDSCLLLLREASFVCYVPSSTSLPILYWSLTLAGTGHHENYAVKHSMCSDQTKVTSKN